MSWNVLELVLDTYSQLCKYLPILCTIVLFSDEIIMVDPKLDTAF